MYQQSGGMFCSWTCASLAPNSCCSAHSGACCRPWWCLHPRAALLPARGIFQPTAMGNALRTRSVRASIQTVCLHCEGLEDAAQPAHDGGPHVLVGLLIGDEVKGVLRAECRSMASQAAPGSVT